MVVQPQVEHVFLNSTYSSTKLDCTYGCATLSSAYVCKT